MIRRLDVKFVLTLILTAAVPMVVSIHLVNQAVETSLGIGLNRDIHDTLERSVEVHRSYIESIKKGHRTFLSCLGNSKPLFDAVASEDEGQIRKVLEGYLREEATTRRISLRTGTGEELTVTSVPLPNEKPFRAVTRGQEIAIGQYTALEVVFGVDRSIMENFETAGQDLETYQALYSGHYDYLSGRVILVYGMFLGLVLIVIIGLGVFWTRRLSRRIHTLSHATQSVAEGDMSVRVETGALDEVGALISSFNKMVAEISSTRARIEYLQKISAWQEIARRLAHEIKNPLTPIHLASQELRSQYKGEDGKFQRLLDQSTEIIEEEVATLRRLVSDFSSFAKLPKVTPEPTDLASFLGDCKNSLQHLQDEDDMRIEWELPRAETMVPLDAMMMKRVIDNLVRNAVEALINGGQASPSVRISTSERTWDRRKEVVVRIEDNGPGILPEHHPSIFDPYFTTKEEGTGLGLAISKKIVLEHGGKIWVDESEDKGAVFHLALPLIS